MKKIIILFFFIPVFAFGQEIIMDYMSKDSIILTKEYTESINATEVSGDTTKTIITKTIIDVILDTVTFDERLKPWQRQLAILSPDSLLKEEKIISSTSSSFGFLWLKKTTTNNTKYEKYIYNPKESHIYYDQENEINKVKEWNHEAIFWGILFIILYFFFISFLNYADDTPYLIFFFLILSFIALIASSLEFGLIMSSVVMIDLATKRYQFKKRKEKNE